MAVCMPLIYLRRAPVQPYLVQCTLGRHIGRSQQKGMAPKRGMAWGPRGLQVHNVVDRGTPSRRCHYASAPAPVCSGWLLL